MEHFPEGIQFKYTWRGYQKRVLAEFEQFISDGALHIVAPPGSGKTVLGLEVMLRLNVPTLILAPTIAVRNQWVDRFCELFLRTGQAPDWISCDIHQPSFLTVSTYQSLHAVCDTGRKKDRVDVLKLLQEQGVKTVVVDEAHHLKNEWWHSLRKLQDTLTPIIVGLTATPPYDVPQAEWDRYIALNGPVDAEITVPELMREGDLCPHQDYVYFSRPSRLEYQKICEFRNGVETLFQDIKTDGELLCAIESLPLWETPDEWLEWIYDCMPYYSSMLIYLHAAGRGIPQTHIEIVGDELPDFPAFDYDWAEILLDLYLNKGRGMFDGCEEHQEKLENRLLRYGVMERGQISFKYNRKINAALAASVEKLDSICDIVRFEYRHLGEELRSVILADYIRKEFLNLGPDADLYTGKLGVLPIFEKLRREDMPGLKLGVLTGSVVIVPCDSMPFVNEKLQELGMASELPSCSLPYDDRYVRITLTDAIRGVMVKLVTDIFQSGGIEVLVGTKSLLGEGWDAPALNTLVLASCVGSFVLSNQMRGRAIRTMRGNEKKTGNIWHLACTDLASASGGGDVEMLKRRFSGFVGISCRENGGIENGVDRLGLPDNLVDWDVVKQFNERTFALAADRTGLTDRWKVGLERGVSLVEEIKMPFKPADREKAEHVKGVYLNRTIAYLVAGICSSLVSFGVNFLETLFRSRPRTLEDAKMLLTIFSLLGAVFFGYKFFKVLRLYLRYRDITKDIRGIGESLLQTLVGMKVVQTPVAKLSVFVQQDATGGVYCHLQGGTSYEKSAFTGALSEVVSAIDNPRYLILRKSRALFFISKTDYHAVPEIMGRKKEWAAYLAANWKKLVGENELIFTRSREGRKILLKARMESLSAYFADDVERVSKWK